MHMRDRQIVKAQSFSCVQLLATPWTGACHALLSRGLPSKNTGVGCHFLFQEGSS